MRKVLTFVLAVLLVVGATPYVFASGYDKEVKGSSNAGDYEQKGNAMAEKRGSVMEEGKEKTAIGGHCPVCLINGSLVKGSQEYVVIHEGKAYYFPAEEQKEMFLADPDKYTKDIEMKYKDVLSLGVKGNMKDSDHEHKGSH